MISFNPIHYFSLGPLRIYTHGTMLAIAIIVCFILASRKAKEYKLDKKDVLDSFVYIVVGALIGARILYVITYYYQFSSFLEIFYVWRGGLVSYGGFIGGFLGFLIFARIRKLDFWKYLDLLAPYVALGEAITRIGCFINWDDYGSYTNLPWGVSAAGDLPRHPAQIYHLLAGLLIFLVLRKKSKNIKFSGQIFSLLLIFYSASRFAVDFFRDYDYQWWVLAPSQWLTILFFTLGIVLYVRKSKSFYKSENKA